MSPYKGIFWFSHHFTSLHDAFLCIWCGDNIANCLDLPRTESNFRTWNIQCYTRKGPRKWGQDDHSIWTLMTWQLYSYSSSYGVKHLILTQLICGSWGPCAYLIRVCPEVSITSLSQCDMKPSCLVFALGESKYNSLTHLLTHLSPAFLKVAKRLWLFYQNFQMNSYRLFEQCVF